MLGTRPPHRIDDLFIMLKLIDHGLNIICLDHEAVLLTACHQLEFITPLDEVLPDYTIALWHSIEGEPHHQGIQIRA